MVRDDSIDQRRNPPERGKEREESESSFNKTVAEPLVGLQKKRPKKRVLRSFDPSAFVAYFDAITSPRDRNAG